MDETIELQTSCLVLAQTSGPIGRRTMHSEWVEFAELRHGLSFGRFVRVLFESALSEVKSAAFGGILAKFFQQLKRRIRFENFWNKPVLETSLLPVSL